MFNIKFSFTGLSVHSDDIEINSKLNGLNARLEISQNVGMNMVIVYVGVIVGALSLILSIISSLLGQKLIGF
jgi:hypothetical protein